MAQQPKSFPEETIEMNTKPLTNIAPDILRKRLLIEGFCADFDDQKAVQLVKEFFQLSEFQSAIF
jgi:hypothetical protein